MIRIIYFLAVYCSCAMSANLEQGERELANAHTALKASDLDKALKLFEIVATQEGGTAEGKYYYGFLLLSKFKTRPDNPNFALGLRYLKAAAGSRFALASRDLGVRYLKGDGVPQSDLKAIECFERNQEDPVCRSYLSIIPRE